MVRELSGGKTEPDATLLQFGRPVEGSDGPLGRLTDVVVRPDERRVTHLVVEDPAGKARLVPAELLVQGPAPDGAVGLSCSAADLATYDSIRSFSYMGFAAESPEQREGTEVGVEDVLAMPSFGGLGFGDYAGDLDGSYGMTYDSIPAGSAELRRESMVVSEDMEAIGNVDGLFVAGEQLTHVVLQQAHASADTITIPIDSVVAIDTDCVTVALPADSPHS